MEKYSLSRFQILQLLSAAVELGVSHTKEKKEFVSLTSAYKKYGRRAIDRWISNEEIEVVRKGTEKQVRVWLSVNRLNELAKADEINRKFFETSKEESNVA